MEKVEPANWWVGMKWNTVQLMVYGKNLQNLKASFQEKGIKVLKVHQNTNLSYCFIDIYIPPQTQAGTYHLVLQQGNEKQTIAYPILQREEKKGKYQGFSDKDVVYLITPDRFANGNTSNDKLGDRFDEFDPMQAEKRHGGDLQGMIQQLDYLKTLGVTAIWVNPLLENAGKMSYHGYACTDLYKIDARFGTNEDYKTFVNEAHKRGLKVIFDHVANHIGIEHSWMKNLPTLDWVNGTAENHLSNKHYKAALIDPHRDATSADLLQAFWFVPSMPDLNQHNPFLGNYLIQNMLWWIEYSGLDGIREDTYPYPYQDFMYQWVEAIQNEYPAMNIVGEIWELQTPMVAAFQKNSPVKTALKSNLPCVMDFPLMEAFRHYLQGKGKLNDVYNVFVSDFLYADANNVLTFIDNHDITRGAYIMQHQQKLLQCFTMLLTTRGIPQLLYGTEIGMVGGESHVELRQDFPGGFPNHAQSAFKERNAAQATYFEPLQKLLKLRQEHPALSSGRFIQYPLTWEDDVYKYIKRDKNEAFLIILNGQDKPKKVSLEEVKHHIVQTQAREMLTNQTISLEKEVEIEPLGMMILKIK
ncbi:MAG: alpha-amylase family glycosyl hydrolase [Bacteroidia bacterium]